MNTPPAQELLRPNVSGPIPAGPATELAELLTDLDAFLRGSPAVVAQLACHYAGQGHPRPEFAARNRIDELSFTAARMQAQQSRQT